MTHKGSLAALWLGLVLGVSGVLYPVLAPPPPPPAQKTALVVYNVADFGAVNDANVANVAVNTVAFQNATNAAANPAAPGAVYIPPGAGFVIQNGLWKVTSSNTVIRGDASMGAGAEEAPTSRIIGIGAGHTLTVASRGCLISGLAFRDHAKNEQKQTDATILVTDTHNSLRDIHIMGANIGVSIQTPINALGEFWLRDILIENFVQEAGISANAGNCTVHINHVIMYSDPQPSYGILVTAAGELIVNNGCDIISMGTCLAIEPGKNGIRDQFVYAVFVSDSLFDSPDVNGVFICPQTNGFVAVAKFTNCWASTLNNNGGLYPSNGFTLDGSQSHPPLGVRPISDVNFVNCNSRSFVQHCGWYCRNVYGLSIIGCTATGNYRGIQTYGCVGVISGNKCGDYSPAPLGYPAGNATYGLLLEKSQIALGTDNLLGGNVAGPILVIP